MFCLLSTYRGVTARLAQCLKSILNVKAVAAAFNQEKVLVGAFSVNVKTDCGTDGSFYTTAEDLVRGVALRLPVRDGSHAGAAVTELLAEHTVPTQ